MHEEDSAWKEILEDLFREFLEFFFPQVHDAIAWTVLPQWLDKEFQALFPHQEDGRRIVDKLGKVLLQSGEEEWILVHVEVQGDSEVEFNERMFRYNVLIRLRYQKEVVSLGVLTDEVRSFRPGLYRWSMLGQLLLFRFPTVKLLHYEGRREELDASRSPFAIVVLAHLEARRARSADERFVARLRLARRLYESGYGRENIRSLYRFLEWVMGLPLDRELALRQRIEEEIEGNIAMPYLATFERIAMEKGRVEGLEQGLEQGRQEGRTTGVQEGLREAVRLVVQTRFGDAGLALLSSIECIEDVERLRSVAEALGRIEGLEDLRALLGSA